jgi:hypothetical protein
MRDDKTPPEKSMEGRGLFEPVIEPTPATPEPDQKGGK